MAPTSLVVHAYVLMVMDKKEDNPGQKAVQAYVDLVWESACDDELSSVLINEFVTARNLRVGTEP